MRLRDLYRDRAVWLYVLITAVFFYRPLTTQTFFFRDLYMLFYPKKLLMVEALRSGQIPLWDPFTHGGQPYIGAYTSLHPSNVLYFVLPTLVAFNLVLVLHGLFGAIAAYWAARVFKLSAVPAFVTGIAFAFCGLSLAALNLTHGLALPWIPMTIGLAHRALRDGRSLAPAAIAASMPLFSASVEVAVLSFATLVVWIAFANFAAQRRARIIATAIVIAGGVGLSLIYTLPATSVVAQSARARERRTYENFSSWSVHPRRLPELFVPQFFGLTHTLSDADYWGSRSETQGFPYFLSLYFGVPVLLLAAVGAVGKLSDVEVPRRAMAALAIVAFVLMLGRYLPGFRAIYDFVPFAAVFRFPVKLCMLAVFPIAILAGCGVERLALRRWIPLACAILFGLAPFFIDSIAALFDFTPLTHAHRVLLTWSFIHAAIASLALLIPRREALAVIVAADLLIAGWSVNAYTSRDLFDPPPLAMVARNVAGPLRLYSQPHPIVLRAPSNDIAWLARYKMQVLDGYTAAIFGIPVIFHDDYDGLAPYATARLSRSVQRMSWEQKRPWLDRGGVRAIVTKDEIHLPGITEVARAVDRRLYVNEHAAPARFSGPCTGRVSMQRKTLNDADYIVDAPCDGHVIFAENHYDGWTSTIDGREVPELRADFAFTAVAVPRGHHAIARRYFPPRFIAGICGTLLTAIALLVSSRAACSTRDLSGNAAASKGGE